MPRIHKGNLVNHDRPNAFEDQADYEKVDRDELEIENFLDQIPTKSSSQDVTKGFIFKTKLDLTDNELEVVLCREASCRYLKKELKNENI